MGGGGIAQKLYATDKSKMCCIPKMFTNPEQYFLYYKQWQIE